MKRIKKTFLTIALLLMSTFPVCLAQGTGDGDTLYVNRKTSDEAAKYLFDDVKKMTFSSKGIQLWSTNWPTEYPYGNVENLTFRSRDLKPSFAMGDVNNDGEVNVSDVMLVVDHILSKMPSSFHRKYADMNGDGTVNVTDAILIVEVILHLNNANASVVDPHGRMSKTARVQQDLARQYLNIYQDDVVIKQVPTTEIDSIDVSETEPRYVNVWRNGNIVLTYQYEAIDSLTLTNKGGYPFSYAGIVGFNDDLYTKNIGILSTSTASQYKTFVNNLILRDGTLLYYAVDNGLDMLGNASIVSPLKNVSLITFTDGLDQGSLMMTDKYGSSYEYLDAMSRKISGTTVGGLRVNAYSVGLRGKDVSNVSLFKQNIERLASSPGNAFEVSSINELREKLKAIADQIISVNNRQTISLKIPGIDSGTLVRFTFDGNAAANSQLYIEGTFNLKDRSLHNVTYHGLKATSGATVQGTQNGIFVTYTFTGLRLETGTGLVPFSSIQHYYRLPSNSLWQKNSEFNSANNTQTSVSHSGAVIFLHLDCSSSLGSDFSKMKQYANEFVDLIANNAEPFNHTAPQNVKAMMDENEWAVHLSWDAAKYAQSYKVYRSSSSGGTYQLVAENVTSTEWTDENPLGGYNYYKISAVCFSSESSLSSYASVNVTLGTPTNIKAMMDDNKWGVNVSWDAVNYAQSYKVYRSSSSNGTYKLMSENVTSTEWTDESPSSGYNYYKVCAVCYGTESSQSYSVSVNVKLDAPTNVVAMMDENAWGVNVSWDAVKYAEYYSVYRSSSSSSNFVKVADSITVTSWRDKAPLNGSNYYRVYAMGHGLTSEASTTSKEVSMPLCPDDHHPHLIDLGLPSGTKWSCCNVDTDHPENQSPTNYGGYYAWGETETKSGVYCESNYQYYKNGSYQSLGSDIAGTEYDVAHVNWGGFWVMPSYEQQKELINNCTYEWTTVNGVKGRMFTSKTNGGSIFLPAAGYRYGTVRYRAGSDGCYWSSTQDPSRADYAYFLYFYSGYVYMHSHYRVGGQSVRPVVRN